MHSSTSIDIRFRKSIVVGFMRGSESEITGNSSGNPPARQTPRLTCSATVRRCALQFVASLQEFAMPITGRPWKASSEKPSAFIHARWRKPLTSRPPNQCWLRSPGAVTGGRRRLDGAARARAREPGRAQPRNSRQSASHISAESRRLSTSTRSSLPWNMSGYSEWGMRGEWSPKP